MGSDRGRVPHSTWIVIAVTVALLGWAVLWFAGDVVTGDDPMDRSSRAYVEEQLAQADGVLMVLPVELPAGYDVGRRYGYNSSGVQTDVEDEAEQAESREVTFIPLDGVQSDGPPAVVQCVELANAKPSLCHTGRAHIQRRLGPSRVTFYVASAYSRDLEPWKVVKLSTDLDKVTWLH